MMFSYQLIFRLHIFDGSSKKALTPSLGLFGNYSNEPGEKDRVKDFESLSSSLFLYFEGLPTYSSFDAIVTVFKG